MANQDHSLGVEIDSQGHPHSHPEPGVINPDLTLGILTWVTFLLLLAILYKFAWKPILSALDTREEGIRKGIEDAEKATEELAKIDETREEILAKAETKAKQEVDRGRKAAVEAARNIEHKAKEEAKIVLGNATHEIKAQTDKAQSQLKQESVDLALTLAGKILEENLDSKKQHKLLEKYIKDFKPELNNE